MDQNKHNCFPLASRSGVVVDETKNFEIDVVERSDLTSNKETKQNKNNKK